jgi:outer membrane receptor protein involved in Fe transport
MRVRNALILSTASIAALAIATPAFGQAAAPADTIPEKTAEGEQVPPTSDPTTAEGQAASETPPTETGGTIVVTGSRIRRDNFSTPQNIDVLTRDDQVLAGTRSTAEVLQSANVTSGTSQISGSFLGFLSDNGQGANTVGLRGLGAARTLVLLNGRRLAPAGVGPQLIAADLNTLPSAVVQRIEVLREGASSIYGSDAIAGVINVITDTSVDGITFDGFADVPEIGAGQSLRGSITAGKTFSRGHIMASFEYREDKGLNFGDRKDTRCARELAFVNGQEVGQTEPFQPGTLRCYPFARAGGGTPAGYFSALFAPGFGGGAIRTTFGGFDTGNPSILLPPLGVAFNNADYNNRPSGSLANTLKTTFLTPMKTLTGYVNGAYELEALGDAELYGEGLFVRRKTKQVGPDRPDWFSCNIPCQQYGPDYSPGDAFFETYYPSYVSPFYPVSWSAAGNWGALPFWAPDRLIGNKQKVDFWRANAGLRGNVGIGDWRYDANVQISRTKGRDDRQMILTSNISNVLSAVLAPAGTPAQFTTTALPGQYQAGGVFTCSSNVTNGAYNGGTCQPVNVYDPNVMLNGAITDAQYDYLYPWLNYTKTKFRQNTFAVSADGSLFPLQGGNVKAAIGFEHRYDSIDDRPGAERDAGELYRFGAADRTKGSDTVNEVFGELNMPFFKDKPFAHLLELDVSGRYTHYKSYGSGFTYHLGAQWAPIPAIRFRGNYGTNFRAPNLYEQFVADEVGFFPNSFDPCANFAANSAPGQPIYDNCLAELTPILDDPTTPANEALNFNPPGGSFQITTTGGAGIVEAETAKTYGFGAVFTAPRSFADLSLAIDYWHINVKDEVGTLSNNILTFCYDSTDYPNNPYCPLIGARYLPGDPNTPPNSAGTIINMQNPYLNIARQLSAGIDFDARYATRLLGGQLTTQLQATRMLTQKIEFFPDGGLNNFNGELGYPGFGSGPKWTGSLDTRFKTANDITFRWGVQYIGPMDSSADANVIFLDTTGAVCAQGSAGCFQVEYDLKTSGYFTHGVSVQWLWRNVGQVTVGVNNLFDNDPPIISDDNVNGFPRFGNFFANGAYDYRGRSFFINVTKTFR